MEGDRSESAGPSLLEGCGLERSFRIGDERIRVLRGVSCAVAQGEWLAVLGASGSGKSTLLHVLGALDRPDAGTVRFGGGDVFSLRGAALDRHRNRHVGFVFQFYHLLPELSLLENVLIPAMARYSVMGWLRARRDVRRRAAELIERLGLAHRTRHRPNRLSGGERQRAAIARALINAPALILADEPTGNLDAESGAGIMSVFRELAAAGQTIVMVTHDTRVAAEADRRLVLEDGVLRSAT